ncbi:MAG TPA: hypothetical protein VGQ37_19855 [Vicinamibacterales bacterium]|jgi:hypothetical protein|nr:hypothetical protein [Vicinamibacterales bacterium]
MLYHVSDAAAIERFEPRPSTLTDAPVVWAVDDERLRNYLLPRDCPRVTYYAGAQTTAADRAAFLESATAVVAIEEQWLERVRHARLYVYELPPDTFECIDECAGYFVTRVAVDPLGVRRCADPIGELDQRGVAVRALPDLWSLRDAVVASSLQFSIIRMRNAQPRSTT